MHKQSYPIKYSTEEVLRLDTQSGYLINDILLKVARSSESIIDIGCGVGSLYKTLEENSVYPKNYFGIDLDSESINTARKRFENYPVRFEVADITQAEFRDKVTEKYDLAVVRLVLWSLPKVKIESVLAIAKLALNPTGKLYLFEPFDDLMHFNSANPLLNKLVKTWKIAMINRGHHLNFGPEIYSLAKNVGFTVEHFSMFTLTSSSENRNLKQQHLSNLVKLFQLLRESDFNGSDVEMTYYEYLSAIAVLIDVQFDFTFTECFYHLLGNIKQ